MDEKKEFMAVALASSRDINEPVPIVPFSDWDYYYIERKLSWKSDEDSKLEIKIPKGFVTDLASIPRVFWTILPKTADYTYPAIFHDYLYWFQPEEFDRARADETLRMIMAELNVSKMKAATIFEAVRLFGGGSWDSNKIARESGERRVLKSFPPKPTFSWDQWKRDPDHFV